MLHSQNVVGIPEILNINVYIEIKSMQHVNPFEIAVKQPTQNITILLNCLI